MSIDIEIVMDFVVESKLLMDPLTELLENAENDMTKAADLAEYGNKVDRVMGGAKNLGLMVDEGHAINTIANYAALCKAVAYKASQIQNNEHLYTVSVAFLLDANEILLAIIDEVGTDPDNVQIKFSETFLERLRWISSQFSEKLSGTVSSGGIAKMSQSEIDNLLSKLGIS